MGDRFILLLDGVNEIPNEDLRCQLAQFREDNPTVPMIFTTRDLSVGGTLGIEKRLEIQPLSSRQIQDFVGQYLPEHGETLLGQLGDRLRELAETPLLLKMLCDVFDPVTQQLPQSQGELFRLFDAKFDDLKGVPPVSADFRRFKPELLRHLAFSMIQGDPTKPTEAWWTLERNRAEKILEDTLTDRIDNPGQKAKEWLEDLLQHHLLQVANNPREIEFHHQLFQEYYAAEELLLCLPELLQDENTFKQDYLNYLKWSESIALMLSIVNSEKQALKVVELALDDVDFMLGVRLVGGIQSQSKKSAIELINNLEIPQILKIELLKEIRSIYSIEKLIEILNSQNPTRVRTHVIETLKYIDIKASTNVALQALDDPNTDVRRIAVKELFFYIFDNDLAIDGLLKALDDEDSHVRHLSANALIGIPGRLHSQAVLKRLMKNLENENVSIRNKAFQIAEFIDSQKIINRWVETAISPYQNLFWNEGKKRERSNINSKADRLIKILNELNSDFCMNERAGEKLANEEEANLIFDNYRQASDKCRETSDERTSVVANFVNSISIGEIGVNDLLLKLKDIDPLIRSAASEALGFTGSESAVNGLLNSLEDEYDIRVSSAKALGRIGNELAIEGLLKALDNADYDLSGEISKALTCIGSELAINGLTAALHQHPNARSQIAYALGSVDNEMAIDSLLEALNDPEYSVCKSAAEALGRIGNPRSLASLWNQLYQYSYDKYIWQAILEIQSCCQYYNYEIWLEARAKQSAELSNLNNNNQGGVASAVTNIFPNATDVKIFEKVDSYHESSSSHQDSS